MLDFSQDWVENIADNSTTINPLLRDFCGHQVWADAEHWRAIDVHPAAAQDETIRNRLHHIHIVQRVFMWAVSDRGTGLAVSKPEEFASFAERELEGEPPLTDLIAWYWKGRPAPAWT